MNTKYEDAIAASWGGAAESSFPDVEVGRVRLFLECGSAVDVLQIQPHDGIFRTSLPRVMRNRSEVTSKAA